VTAAVLKAMSRRELTRLFRQKAREHHPDTGGQAESFIRLQEAYQSLVRRK
jgi:DnaJ-class molecular chaperone